MKDVLPTFTVGHGDKELYWIAATIAREAFAWEPFIAGTYGDCGVVSGRATIDCMQRPSLRANISFNYSF